MTTNDQATGRSAAARRPLSGSLRFLCCGVLLTAALPAFAQQATAAIAEAATIEAAAASSAADSAINSLTPVVSDAMPLPNRAMMFAGDINRLIASQPVTGTGTQPEPATSSRIQKLLQGALALLGTPYRWGGTTTSGFDCSGLVGYVFRNTLGLELPRVSRDMARSGQLISDRAQLSPGDLVFFGRSGQVDHVGIYVGSGRFVHAPRTGKNVMVSSLDGYWGAKFMQARRVAGI